MDKQFLFNFKSDISNITISDELNNPFKGTIPNIARIAAAEFQEYINSESEKWNHDFKSKKGKMFGILVVKKDDNSYGYLGTISGKLPGNATCDKFIPSVYDVSSENISFSINMKELTEIGIEIKKTTNQSKIIELTKKRRLKSMALQELLFENYIFSNILGKKQNVSQIFKNSSHGNPPSAAGECAAPKLLQYSFNQNLKPIAIAEFWWGANLKNNERAHKVFYPACKNKCRPILEYMLNDTELFN